MAKSICVLKRSEVYDIARGITPSCRNHYHISKAEANELAATVPGEAKGARHPQADWFDAHKSKQIVMSNGYALRGLSVKTGEYHAGAICSREEWALVMLSQMKSNRGGGTQSPAKDEPYEQQVGSIAPRYYERTETVA